MDISEKNLQKLRRLMDLMDDDALTRAEFTKSFADILKFIKGIKDRNDVIIAGIERGQQILDEDIKSKTSDTLLSVKQEVSASLALLRETVRGKLGQIDTKLAEVQDGEPGEPGNPGKDADEEKIKKELLKELKKYIDDLFDELEARILTQIKSIPERPTTTIFGPGKTRVITVDLSDQLDGAKTTFRLGTSFGVISVNSDSAPFGAFRPIIDYTEVGRDLVFTAAVDPAISLAQGHSLIVSYLR